MKDNKSNVESQITELYDRIQAILIELDIKWVDLALLIGVSPKTLSSMRSNKVNPSWTTVRKIATALDVSLDELIFDSRKTSELYELYWMFPRVLNNPDIQSATCRQCMIIAEIVENKVISEVESRIDVRRKKVRNMLAELKGVK